MTAHIDLTMAWFRLQIGLVALLVVLAAVLANGGLAERTDTPPAGLTPVVQLDVDHTPHHRPDPAVAAP